MKNFNKLIFHKLNCSCIVCKNKRKESHKIDCTCFACKLIKGESKGKRNLNYKHGNYIKQKCSICGKLLSSLAKTCSKHRIYSEQIRKNMSDAAIKKYNKYPKLRNHLSTLLKKRYRDPKFLELYSFNIKLKPNKPESLLKNRLNNLFPNEYKYVGDGKVILDGYNPDFINVNGQKKLIEFFGNYWHANPYIYKDSDIIYKNLNASQIWKNDKKRIETFKRLGYETLIIWEHELKDLNRLNIKLLQFHNPNIKGQEIHDTN